MTRQEKQSRYILIFSLAAGILLIFTLTYQGITILNSTDETSLQETTLTQVAILASDDRTDQSWGSLAYEGLLKIENSFPVSVELYSGLYTDALKEEQAGTVLEEDIHILMGHGGEYSDLFTRLAPEHPGVYFITLHGEAEHDNQAVYTFDKGGIEFFAGMAAVMKSETNQVGIIDAFNERDNYPQFEEGMSKYEPDSTLHYSVVNDRNDGDRAISLMEDMLENDVDVIYSRGNAFNQDIIELAKQENVYIVGYIDDQNYMAPDLVLTSVLNCIPNAYSAIMSDYFSEEGIQSGVNELTESHGAFMLAPFGPMFSEEELDIIYNEIDKRSSRDIIF